MKDFASVTDGTNRTFTISVSAMFLAAFGFFTAIIFLPRWFQTVAGDSALTALETPAIPGEVSASPRTDSSDDLWKVQGKVRAVTVADIVVETPQGQTVRVDASKLSPWTRQTLRPGDEIKLFGVPQPDQRLVANGFIQLMPTAPSASPSSR